jgi:mono/diheme cytochrome c family protein
MNPLHAASASILLLTALAGNVQAQEATARTTLDGVFTEEQASRGKEVFTGVCGLCHAEAEFHGPIWAITWNGRTTGQFLDQVRASMPLDRPGSLSRQEYADILAYVLKLNGYPAADQELPGDSELLKDMSIAPLPK